MKLHYLFANMKSKKKTKTIAVIDCETDPFLFGRLPQPFAWCYKDESVERVFWGENSTRELAQFIADHCDETYIIYAHNGGRFDFHFLIPYLDEDLKLINGRIALCNIKGNKAELRDSWLIFPEPLSAYNKDQIAYEIFEKDIREDRRGEIVDYLRADCRYLLDIVVAFNLRFGDKLTAAGTAMAELKKSGYIVETTGEQYDLKIRPFYYGGRVQCFEKGRIEGPLVYLDINSAYPFAMLHPHPSSTKLTEHLKLPDVAGGWLADIDAISHGALPLREEKTRKLQFVCDDVPRRFTATGWEIAAGLDTGMLKVLRVHRVIKFGAYRTMSDYVNEHYAARKQYKKDGDKLQEKFEKLLLNSAYGKFAQDSRDFSEYKLMEDHDDIPDGDDWEFDSELYGRALFKRSAATGRFYNCATAASITGFVRAYLWRALCASKKPIYCDTDSIICQSYGGSFGVDLGQWKLEADCEVAFIGGRKLYAVRTVGGDWKTATKGFRMDPKQLACHIEEQKPFTWQKDAPAYSAKFGPRFLERTINFS